eukprot:1993953-Amphidinium_carterae.1
MSVKLKTVESCTAIDFDHDVWFQTRSTATCYYNESRGKSVAVFWQRVIATPWLSSKLMFKQFYPGKVAKVRVSSDSKATTLKDVRIGDTFGSLMVAAAGPLGALGIVRVHWISKLIYIGLLHMVAQPVLVATSTTQFR